MIVVVNVYNVAPDPAVLLVTPLLIAEHRLVIWNNTVVRCYDGVAFFSVNIQRRLGEGQRHNLCVKRNALTFGIVSVDRLKLHVQHDGWRQVGRTHTAE